MLPRTGSVDVLGNHTIFESYGSGAKRVVGEILNRTHHLIGRVRVTVHAYNTQHELVGTSSEEIFPNDMDAGDKACFSVLLPDPTYEIVSYTFEPPSYYIVNASNPEAQLTLVDDSGFVDPQYHEYRVQGHVRNDTQGWAALVTPSVTLYNAAGKVVDCKGYGQFRLASGATSEFHIDFFDHQDVSEYAQVTRHRVRISGFIQP
jgi:hypothetical protein